MGQKNSKIDRDNHILKNELNINADILINNPSGVIFKKLKFTGKKMSGLNKFYCFTVDNTVSNLLTKNPLSFNIDIYYSKSDENGKLVNTKQREFYPENYKHSKLNENLEISSNIINNKSYTDIINNSKGIILRHTSDSKMKLIQVIIKING